MHSKKSLIKVLTRILFAGGFVFLIVGLLLSALNTSALAAGVPALDLAQATTQVTPPNCFCTTPTPERTGPAPTKTGAPKTPAPPRPPMNINLSSICGYTFDNYELWKVANNGSAAANFTWKVVGSNESGSGSVAANSSTYFTTSAGQKTVQLLVNNQLMDSESCLAPCKKELQLSYSCTTNGLTWQATNPNSFGVDYTVRVDGKTAGKGAMKGNESITVATTTSGAHTVEVTWTDTRPGTHTVTLSSPANSCGGNVVTVTPTVTSTLMIETVTLTSTPTTTLTPIPDVILTTTATPTATSTSDIATQTSTVTPTTTLTPEGGSISTVTSTPTSTNTPTTTLTPEGGSISTVTLTPTSTVTPTTTLTPQSGSISTVTLTPTITSTALGGFVPTVTATTIVTLSVPNATVTSTPVLIPVTGADMTLPIGVNTLGLFGGLFTNIGLFTLGLALALTGITSQMKE
jgi:hypothetical protein